MKVRIFRQRVSQVHESEVEINSWLAEVSDQITVQFVEQSSYLDNAQPGYLISVWYEEK